MKKNKEEYDYINSISQALVDKAPSSTKVVLYLIFTLVLLFFIWAYFAQVDQLVRGESKVIPYGQNKVVQNYEGGIITEILVEEGDFVKKGETLLKIEDKQSFSRYEKNLVEIQSLEAQKNRLYAEANDLEYKKSEDEFSLKEYELYLSDKKNQDSKLSIIKDQVSQKQKEANEIKSKILHLDQSFKLIRKEQDVMEPLVKKGIVSKVQYLQLLREANSIKEELEATKLSLITVKSAINEYKNREKEAKNEFQNEAQKNYNDVNSQIKQLQKQNLGLADQVKRRTVVAPVSGHIKAMYVHTIGGSVKPGMDLVEIVPDNKKLLVETKISPEDIAFLHPGQEVTLKFTAYDFTIYGALKGKIERIAPDSITDKENNTYYLVNIKAEKNYLENNGNKLKIIPGMRGSADIITGKKTVLTYLLKPIIKTKYYALTEH